MKERIREMLEKAFCAGRAAGDFQTDVLPEFAVEIPRMENHGDIAANIAMLLAKQEKKPPRDIAQLLIDKLNADSRLVRKIEIAGPGFINFHFAPGVWHVVLREIEDAGDAFGATDLGRGQKILVEFVSANPTGPLHIGHGRGAAVGDAVANILSFAGYEVEREYYINDVGNQMQNLGRAVYLRYLELLRREVAFPEDLYRGAYIYDIARDVILKHGSRFLDAAEDEIQGFFSDFAARYILNGIKKDLEAFNVRFDSWFSEKQLYDSGEVDGAIGRFKRDGLAYTQEGALWFRSTRFGDEKDRVMVRDDGRTTYFASDVAYHLNKFKRGAAQAIDIWGADHHGYVPRIKAVLQALDIDLSSLSVVLVQMVNLLRDGKPVAMSTRSGEFVTLREVVDEVGKDAARFSFLTRRTDAQLDFDLSVAKKQSDENPVYYVQYAHARICSIIAFAQEKDLAVPAFADINAGLLSAPEEITLLKKIAQFPWVVAGSAQALEPHRVSTYLMELVALFHSYYNKCRVITGDRDLSLARLYLIRALRVVLQNGLSLVGVSAPEKM